MKLKYNSGAYADQLLDNDPTLQLLREIVEERKCKKHPQYKAIRKPRADCSVCWSMYNESNP